MKDPLDGIFIVGSSEDVLHDQLSRSCHDNRLISEVRMLEEDTIIFLVNADCILDSPYSTSLRGEVGIHIVDGALAVATKREAVGHVTAAILAKIKGVLAVVGAFGLSATAMLASQDLEGLHKFCLLRYHHLCER